MTEFNPIQINETSGSRPLFAPDKGQSFHAVDPTIYPGSYNLYIMNSIGVDTYQINYYTGASSFINTGSLMFTEMREYSGSLITKQLFLSA